MMCMFLPFGGGRWKADGLFSFQTKTSRERSSPVKPPAEVIHCYLPRRTWLTISECHVLLLLFIGHYTSCDVQPALGCVRLVKKKLCFFSYTIVLGFVKCHEEKCEEEFIRTHKN